MTINEASIRRYLLGEARDEEQEQTERRLMTDREYFQDFLRLEEALIDEYIRGALNKHDRERFENYFIKAPERRESLEFAKALRRYVTQDATLNSEKVAGLGREGLPPVFVSWQARSRAVIASLACVALLFVACTAWLLAERARLKGQVEQLQTERGEAARSEEELKQQIDQQGALSDSLVQRLNQAQAELEEKEQEIARLREANAPGQNAADAGLVSMLLAPELHRGGEAPRVAYLSKGSNRLRLKMVVEGERYKMYRAEVRTAEGVEILRSDELKAKASRNQMIVEIELAAGRIAQGDYMIALSGAAGDGGYEKISTYHFRVVRR
ncbi:MAG TPA: hypothetical protein VF131_06780 [Blastocatellia bacterium]|nr:hypothetical protein [Blastocatellia bacterium]